MPLKVTADAIYDTAKIRKYNLKKGTKSNIPLNRRNQSKKKRERPIKVDQREYKKKNAIKRFFSWVESCKKYFQNMKSKKNHI